MVPAPCSHLTRQTHKLLVNVSFLLVKKTQRWKLSSEKFKFLRFDFLNSKWLSVENHPKINWKLRKSFKKSRKSFEKSRKSFGNHENHLKIPKIILLREIPEWFTNHVNHWKSLKIKIMSHPFSKMIVQTTCRIHNSSRWLFKLPVKCTMHLKGALSNAQ